MIIRWTWQFQSLYLPSAVYPQSCDTVVYLDFKGHSCPQGFCLCLITSHSQLQGLTLLSENSFMSPGPAAPCERKLLIRPTLLSSIWPHGVICCNRSDSWDLYRLISGQKCELVRQEFCVIEHETSLGYSLLSHFFFLNNISCSLIKACHSSTDVSGLSFLVSFVHINQQCLDEKIMHENARNTSL